MRLRLSIEGMLAVHAKRAVFTALAGVEGVSSAEVEMGEALVHGDRLDEARIREAIESVGCRVVRVARELPTLGG
jgi:copper chaperone CopZ